MKPQLNSEFDNHDWYSWHDVIVEVLLKLDKPRENKYLSDEALQTLFNILPEHTKLDAHHYGLSDTVFRDGAYGWLVANWENVKENI